VIGAPVAEPRTIANAIRIGNPASWQGAISARDESGGAIQSVTDEQILDAYSSLARCDGVFCEPASAAAVAGLRRRARENALDGIDRVVCVLTGNGLKDPDTAQTIGPRVAEVAASVEEVREALRA